MACRSNVCLASVIRWPVDLRSNACFPVEISTWPDDNDKLVANRFKQWPCCRYLSLSPNFMDPPRAWSRSDAMRWYTNRWWNCNGSGSAETRGWTDAFGDLGSTLDTAAFSPSKSGRETPPSVRALLLLLDSTIGLLLYVREFNNLKIEITTPNRQNKNEENQKSRLDSAMIKNDKDWG